ncbi:MAG: hypothetical protein R2771_13490 [Saprospiraceae bacterium]
MIEKSVDIDKNSNFDFDVSDFTDGIYLIKVQDQKGGILFNEKIIVTNKN